VHQYRALGSFAGGVPQTDTSGTADGRVVVGMGTVVVEVVRNVVVVAVVDEPGMTWTTLPTM